MDRKHPGVVQLALLVAELDSGTASAVGRRQRGSENASDRERP